MSINPNMVTWLLDATGMSRIGGPLTTDARPGGGSSSGRVRSGKRPEPPPPADVGQLSAHLRRDIGLES